MFLKVIFSFKQMKKAILNSLNGLLRDKNSMNVVVLGWVGVDLVELLVK